MQKGSTKPKVSPNFLQKGTNFTLDIDDTTLEAIDKLELGGGIILVLGAAEREEN